MAKGNLLKYKKLASTKRYECWGYAWGNILDNTQKIEIKDWSGSVVAYYKDFKQAIAFMEARKLEEIEGSK